MPNQGGKDDQKHDSKKKGAVDNKSQQSKASNNSDECRGGKGNFAEDPQRAAEAGRKGGKA